MKVRHLLLASTLAWGSSLAQVETKADPAKGIQAIIDSHQETMAEFMTKVRALPKEEQRAFYQSDYPKPDKAVSALGALVDAHPKDPSTLDALTWIARSTRGSGLDEKSFTNLKENFLDHDKIGEVAMALVYAKSAEAQTFLTTVSEKSKSKNARGMALYARSIGIQRDKSKTAEHDALVSQIIADHPDLEFKGRKIVAGLKAKKEAAVKFAIGAVAPEIIGKDADGNEMKLSDYKGKVVVLDFWGDW